MFVGDFTEDLIGWKSFGDRLLSFIEVDRHFVEGSLVLGLSSRYGSGKTTFLRMWKNHLQSLESQKLTVVSLNAWESDYFGDPLFAIVSALVGSIEESGQDANPIKEAAKDIGWMATAIGSQIVKKATGVDLMAVGDTAEKKRKSRQEAKTVPMDGFAAFQHRKSAMLKLKSALSEFITNSGEITLFLVDELDRCRPDYAISYLETIKHIFDMHGAVFILAADRHHLCNSAKTAFGRDLDFEEYYRKFVHREVNLPPMDETAYRKIAEAYTNHFLEREGLRRTFLNFGQYRRDVFPDLAQTLKLTPRQIQECFRILGHVLSTDEERAGRLLRFIAYATIAMVALRAGRPAAYHKLGQQCLTPTEAVDLIVNDLNLRNADWWFTLFATGQGILLDKDENLIDVMKTVKIVSENFTERDLGLMNWIEGWGHHASNRFAQTYQRIEQIMHW